MDNSQVMICKEFTHTLISSYNTYYLIRVLFEYNDIRMSNSRDDDFRPRVTPCRNALTSDWFLNRFVMVVYDRFSNVYSEFSVQGTTKNSSHRQPLKTIYGDQSEVSSLPAGWSNQSEVSALPAGWSNQSEVSTLPAGWSNHSEVSALPGGWSNQSEVSALLAGRS